MLCIILFLIDFFTQFSFICNKNKLKHIFLIIIIFLSANILIVTNLINIHLMMFMNLKLEININSIHFNHRVFFTQCLLFHFYINV